MKKEASKKTENMTMQECIVLDSLRRNGYTNQRIIAEETELSIGMVNQSLKALEERTVYINKSQDCNANKNKAKNKFVEKIVC